MADLSFELDWRAVFILIAFSVFIIILHSWLKRHPSPRMFYSSVASLGIQRQTFKARCSQLPRWLANAALVLFFIAFLDPRIFIKKESSHAPPTDASEGIAIYLALDRSGSMAEPVYTASRKLIPKIELLKELTTDFIKGAGHLQGRANDMIGLVAFARVPQVLSPLTLDHQSILDQLKTLETVKDKSQDGTAIGYAIYKTAHLIAAVRHYAKQLSEKEKRAYDIKSTIVILVTDGLQEANPLDEGNSLRTMDVPSAAAYAAQQGIRLYMINIEPKLASEEFAPFRRQMQHAAESTGGKFFFVNVSTSLQEIYKEIDQLEKSKFSAPIEASLPKDMLPHLYERIVLFPLFLMAGMLCIFVSILFEGSALRRFP